MKTSQVSTKMAQELKVLATQAWQPGLDPQNPYNSEG